VNLGVLDVAHALVVADDQGQERHHHHAAVGDVAIEQVDRVGDAHVFGGFVDVDRPAHRRRLVKSSVVLTSTLVPVEDSAAKWAAASR
jgi:hypothetical protein